ncbi:MAG: HEPN domain-containing protein [Candidatus Diapherotrites archaeon]
MKISELVEKGHLIRCLPGRREIDGSLALSERFLEKAKGNEKIEYYDIALSLAYQSMFHAARALLFKNGCKERSHKAVVIALKEIYGKEKELARLIEALDAYRISRHAIQYSGAGCSKEDAEEAIKDARKFLDLADALLAKAEKNGGSERNKKAPSAP